MKRQSVALASVAAISLCAALPLQAETVMLEQAGLVSGRQSHVIALQIGGRGQMSVSLSDLGWAGNLTDLSFSLSRTNGLLSANPAMQSLVTDGPGSPGLTTFDISEAGTYYACVSGVAGGPYNLGLYGLRIAFASADTPEVALPAAAWLLLSGLGGLCGMAIRRGKAMPAGAMVAA